jgi:hypothetical protein
MRVKEIYVLPCDISEAQSATSDKIFAIRTAAVTQQFPTCTRYDQFTIVFQLSKSFSLFINLREHII